MKCLFCFGMRDDLIIICLILSLPFPLMVRCDYEPMAFHHLLWNLEGNSIMHSWYLSSNGMYSLPFSCDNLSLPATSFRSNLVTFIAPDAVIFDGRKADRLTK